MLPSTTTAACGARPAWSRSRASSVTRPCLSIVAWLADEAKARSSITRDLAALGLGDHLGSFGFERLDAANADTAVVAEEEVAVVAEFAPVRRGKCHPPPFVELPLVDPDKHAPRSSCFPPPRRTCRAGNAGVLPSNPHSSPICPHCQPSFPISMPILPRAPPLHPRAVSDERPGRVHCSPRSSLGGAGRVGQSR